MHVKEIEQDYVLCDDLTSSLLNELSCDGQQRYYNDGKDYGHHGAAENRQKVLELVNSSDCGHGNFVQQSNSTSDLIQNFITQASPSSNRDPSEQSLSESPTTRHEKKDNIGWAVFKRFAPPVIAGMTVVVVTPLVIYAVGARAVSVKASSYAVKIISKVTGVVAVCHSIGVHGVAKANAIKEAVSSGVRFACDKVKRKVLNTQRRRK